MSLLFPNIRPPLTGGADRVRTLENWSHEITKRLSLLELPTDLLTAGTAVTSVTAGAGIVVSPTTGAVTVSFGSSGTTNTVAKWTSGSILGDSGITDDGAAVTIASRNVGIGASPTNLLTVKKSLPGATLADFCNTSATGLSEVNYQNAAGQTRLSIGYDNANSRAFIAVHNGTTALNLRCEAASLLRIHGDADGIGSDIGYTGLSLVRGSGAGTEIWYIGRDGVSGTDGLIFRRNSTTNDLTINTSGNATFAGNLAVNGGLTAGDAVGDAHTLRGTLNLNLTAGSNGQIAQISGGVPVWGAPSTASIPTGSGTTNTLTKWTGASTLGNSSIADDGSRVDVSGTARLYNNIVDFLPSSDADGTGAINWTGFNGGTTRFRDLWIGNGKSEVIASFVGSTKAVTLEGALSIVGDCTVAGGDVSLTNATSNIVAWNTSGLGAPAFTTRSAGTKLVLYPEVGAAAVDWALGMEGGAMWQSVAHSGGQFKWYAATTNVASLNGLGDFAIAKGYTGQNIGLTGGNAAAGYAVEAGKGSSINGAARIYGTVDGSYFMFSADEHTYIRGGKAVSAVLIGDSTNTGGVYLGSTSNHTIVQGSLFVNANATLGDSSADSHTINGELTVVDEATFGVSGGLVIRDIAAQAAGVGGQLIFRGSYTGSTPTEGASIKLTKTNGTDGNYSFDLAFGTRPNGGSLTERMRISDQGAVTIQQTLAVNANATLGNATSDRHTINGSLSVAAGANNVTIDAGTIDLAIGSTTWVSIGTGGTIALNRNVVVGDTTTRTVGFYGSGGQAQQTVTGSRGGNAALADLLTKLANLGLIVDGTTA
jgi:hypothetical protein